MGESVAELARQIDEQQQILVQSNETIATATANRTRASENLQRLTKRMMSWLESVQNPAPTQRPRHTNNHNVLEKLTSKLGPVVVTTKDGTAIRRNVLEQFAHQAKFTRGHIISTLRKGGYANGTANLMSYGIRSYFVERGWTEQDDVYVRPQAVSPTGLNPVETEIFSRL